MGHGLRDIRQKLCHRSPFSLPRCGVPKKMIPSMTSRIDRVELCYEFSCPDPSPFQYVTVSQDS